MASILAKMFEHNRWANLRAVDACAPLSDGQLDATVQGCAGAVRDTLMHIAGAEQRYVMRLSGRPETYSERNGWPGIDRLRQVLDESGRAFVDLAERAVPDQILRGEYGGSPYEMPVFILYVQAINHATEHRSQIATILTQQGLEPPDFSSWAWGS
jgi:uncharacterized damage-inducible protein DinB